MSRNEIITYVDSRKDEWYKIIKTITKASLTNGLEHDVYQDMMIHLLNIDEVTLNNLYNNNQFNYYISAYLKNQMMWSPRSTFARKYKQTGPIDREYSLVIDDNVNNPYNKFWDNLVYDSSNSEEMYELLDRGINSLNDKEKKVINLWLELGTIENVTKAMVNDKSPVSKSNKIYIAYVSNLLKQARQKLKTFIENEKN